MEACVAAQWPPPPHGGRRSHTPPLEWRRGRRRRRCAPSAARWAVGVHLRASLIGANIAAVAASAGAHCGVSGIVNQSGFIHMGHHHAVCRQLMVTGCDEGMNSLARVCPGECPFIVPSQGYSCLFACVEAGDCASFNVEMPFANHHTKRCEHCGVRFCKVCRGRELCEKCHDRFVLSADGKHCGFDVGERLQLEKAGMIIGGLLAVLVVFGVCYTCVRHRSPEVSARNLLAMRLARQHRHFCKVQDWNASGDCIRGRYNLCVNMHRRMVLGVGLGLFYNSFIFLTIVAVTSLAGTFAVFHRSHIRKALVGIVGQSHQQDMSSCSAQKMDLQQELHDFARANFAMLSGLYLILFAFSYLYGLLQQRWAAAFDADNSTMRDYALELKGFGPDTTTDEPSLRDDLEDRFRELVPDVELVGVSICYDYHSRAQEVDEQLWRFMQRLDGSAGDEAPDQVEKDQKVVHSWFAGDNTLTVGQSVFCIFRHKQQMEAVLRVLEENPGVLLWKNGCGGRLQASQPFFEPPSVFWWHTGISVWQFRKNLVKGTCRVAGEIVAFGLLVMWPYSEFIIKPSSGAGSTPTGTLFAVAGILLGNMNMFLCMHIWFQARNIGFLNKDKMDCVIFLANASLSSLNTAFNICMTLYHVFFASAISWAELLDGRTLRSMSLQNEFAANIYHMCVPGGMFVGYIMMPIMGGLVPYVWNQILMLIIYVGGCLPNPLLKVLKALLPWAPDSCEEYPVRNAERGLEPMEVGLPWDYAANIVNPSICFAMLLFMSPSTWRIFFALSCWSLFVYVYSRWVHLRFNKAAFYTTHRLDVTVNFAWGVPLSIVAAAWARWGLECGALPATRWIVVASFAGSLAAWILVYSTLRPWAIPEAHDVSDRPYEETEADTMYSWFNTNPILVLKSHYCPHLLEHHIRPLASDRRTTVLFEVGKEYLLLDQEQRRKANLTQHHYDPLEFETYLDPVMEFFEELLCPRLVRLADEQLRIRTARVVVQKKLSQRKDPERNEDHTGFDYRAFWTMCRCSQPSYEAAVPLIAEE